jgi:predicted lipoprotein
LKKTARYLLTITALLVIGYHSVYFKKLDAVKAATSKSFDAKSYARTYFTNKLTPALNGAVEINSLLGMLQKDKEKTFDQYSHALGIGNIRFFLVRGEGEITAVNEDDVTVLVKGDTAATVLRIATEFVYGNAIRDASGGIDINAFNNTMDFNNVSVELNKIVRSEVLPSFKRAAKKGAFVVFSGAIELNRKHLDTEHIEVMPAALNIRGTK